MWTVLDLLGHIIWSVLDHGHTMWNVLHLLWTHYVVGPRPLGHIADSPRPLGHIMWTVLDRFGHIIFCPLFTPPTLFQKQRGQNLGLTKLTYACHQQIRCSLASQPLPFRSADRAAERKSLQDYNYCPCSTSPWQVLAASPD